MSPYKKGIGNDKRQRKITDYWSNNKTKGRGQYTEKLKEYNIKNNKKKYKKLNNNGKNKKRKNSKKYKKGSAQHEDEGEMAKGAIQQRKSMEVQRGNNRIPTGSAVGNDPQVPNGVHYSNYKKSISFIPLS